MAVSEAKWPLRNRNRSETVTNFSGRFRFDPFRHLTALEEAEIIPGIINILTPE